MLSDGNKDGKKIQVQHPFLHISLPLLLHDYSVKLPSSRFMKEMSYVVTKKKCCLCSCSIFFFWLSIPLIFTLLAASISHFLTAAIKFSCFSFNEIRPPLFISLSLTFSRSFIHVSEDKNLVNKKTRLCH